MKEGKIIKEFDNTNKDINQIERDTERDNYLNSSEALEYGLIDKIL